MRSHHANGYKGATLGLLFLLGMTGNPALAQTDVMPRHPENPGMSLDIDIRASHLQSELVAADRGTSTGMTLQTIRSKHRDAMHQRGRMAAASHAGELDLSPPASMGNSGLHGRHQRDIRKSMHPHPPTRYMGFSFRRPF